MKLKIKSIIALLIILCSFSCNKETSDPNIDQEENKVECMGSNHPFLSLLDFIPTEQYFNSDILSENNLDICGVWKFVNTSGDMGVYQPDFDYLIVKPYSIFGLVKEGSLITTGKIELNITSNQDTLIEFVSDSEPNLTNIILYDPRMINLGLDTLSLYSLCCDKPHEHFKKENE